MASVLMSPPAERVLDPASLREPEVAASPTARQRRSRPSMRSASVALSPTSALLSVLAFT